MRDKADDFARRIRVVRNLLAASEDEIRPEAIPRIIADVERIILDGNLENVTGFNRIQLQDEIEKRSFLAKNPRLEGVLFRLEDHPILKGSLMAFDLNPERFSHRANSFDRLLKEPDLQSATGGLLAIGEYHRKSLVGWHRVTPSFHFFCQVRYREISSHPQRGRRRRHLLFGNTDGHQGIACDLGQRSALPRLLSLFVTDDFWRRWLTACFH
jgi:hypothetical protein